MHISFGRFIDMNRKIVECEENTRFIMNTLNSLGFQVNLEKSVIELTQNREFFGLEFQKF